MSIIFHKEPELENPVLIACWPGIANIGLVAVESLREMVRAELFAEIEPWEFFYPTKVSIKAGILKTLEFPKSRFYYKKGAPKDLIFFIGEEQPTDGRRFYAEGAKAFKMANLVLDVALKFGCKRIYTSGAAVALIHHTIQPKIWAVPNFDYLICEVKKHWNTILMSEIEGRGGQGNITGLNGLLLGVAKKRGIEGICVMGEIPIYLQRLPMTYPKASKSVLEMLTTSLGLNVDLSYFDALSQDMEKKIESFYEQIPIEIKDQLDKLKYDSYTHDTDSISTTEEDREMILEKLMIDIEKSLRKGDEEDSERAF